MTQSADDLPAPAPGFVRSRDGAALTPEGLDPSAPRLWATAIPSAARLIAFRGNERLSTPYRFEVAFSLPVDHELDMPATLGTRMTLEIESHAHARWLQHGVIAATELLDASAEAAIYLAVMVPELWHLDHSVHSRIYTDVTLPEIIGAVLDHAGVGAYELRLRENYPSLEHVCQYRESDLAFVSRLMERDGLYYFFEHGEERERLVITDHLAAHPTAEAERVRFDPWSSEGEGQRAAALSRIRCRVAALPAAVRLTDYDPLRPSLPVRGEAAVSRGRGEVVLYGENLRSPDDGARLARLRAEELRAARAIYEAEGAQTGLRSGHTFELDGHPRADFNQSYHVVAIHHRARIVRGARIVDELFDLPDQSHRVRVEAIPADVPYRAPRVTPWPRIDGVTDGIVDGSTDSDLAQVDEHGRYRVRMFFDESDLVDGSASTWVRMLQPHGGGTEGMHFPLRKGTEVHMIFLGGDPDRPVIVGTAPNAHKPSKVTEGNSSENVLRSGANNQLVMDDAAGGERIDMSTPNQSSFLHMGAGADNFVTSTAGNGREHVGGNRSGTIGGTFDESVGGAVTIDYGATFDQTVAGPVTLDYGATLDETVAGAVTLDHGSTQSVTVAADADHDYGANLAVTIAGTLDQTVDGAASLTFASTLDEQIDGAFSLTVNAITSEVHSAAKSTSIDGAHSLSATGAQLIEGLASQTIHGGTQQIESDGLQVLSSTTHRVEAANATTQASTIALEGGASVTVEAPEVGVSAGVVGIDGGDVTVNGGAIHIAGGGIVEISAGIIKLN